MKAVYLDKVKTFSEKELQTPKCEDNQVVVQVKAVGICGSDIHYWKHGRIGQFVVNSPIVLGHECSGVVKAVGKSVTKCSIGDKVVLEPGVPCMKCEHCLQGHYNLCQNIVFFATPPDDGALMETIVYDESFVFRMPDEITDFGMATLVEPLSVGVFATKKIAPGLGEKVIIFGAGIIGIACLLAAKAAGCTDVAVADIRDGRLELAQKMGADQIINTQTECIQENSFHIGYEATGTDICYNLAVKCIKPGGRVVTIGMGGERQEVAMVDYVCKEILLIPSFRYANAYPIALKLLADNKDKLSKLITHRIPFSLTGVEKAFDIADQNPSAVKVIVEFSGA